LSGLGAGLTVVLGPNEAGKSTYTALTRHVLYGFPDARTKERSYKPRVGDRAGRLVFADEAGEWAIERADGKSRGSVTVSTLSGAERPGLLGELVGGVSEESFRAIFGFGLDELALVGNGGTKDGIVARLYAAGAGLAVNPMDVRNSLDARAAEFFSPRGQKPQVNALASQIREARRQIRELEAEAREYGGEQARLNELAVHLAPLKVLRDELDVSVRVAERDLQLLAGASDQAVALADELVQCDSAITELERSIEGIDVDQRVIAVAPELSELLEGSSGFRQRLEAISSADNSADEIAQRIAAGPALPPGAHDSAESRAAVDAWRDRLTRLQAESDAAQRAASQSSAKAIGAESVAAQQQPVPASGGRALAITFATVAVALGVVFAAAGILLVPQQLLVSALGGAVLLLGVVGLTVALLRRPPVVAPPLSDEAARLRVDAEAARVLAEGAAAELGAARSEWRTWLAEQDLNAHGDDPAAVRQLLDELRERDTLAADAARCRAEAARERDAAEEWVIRLVDLTRRFDDGAGQIPPLASALDLAARSRSILERARAAQAERDEVVRELAAANAARRGLAERAETASAIIAQIAASHGLDPTDPLPALQTMAAGLVDQRQESADAYERLAEEHAVLRGQLDNDGRGDRMTRARQELEGLTARATAAADAYLVSALGVRLMNLARERFERERQPEVVRIAGRVFSQMTLGRYTSVRIPLDSEISVVSSAGDLKPAAELSQGTAEQLYLALRVGLISSLGDLGRHLPVLMDDVAVNYDAERLLAASAAIAELTRVRQVVLFTCHAATAEVMMAAIPEASLVALDRCELRG
jgi:uncharacterized protein YhaN